MTHPNSSFGGKGIISLTHSDYLNDPKRLSQWSKSDLVRWKQGIDQAIFAICCHAAMLLPRTGTPLYKGLPKDSWQRGSKITKKKILFQLIVGVSITLPYWKISVPYWKISVPYSAITLGYRITVAWPQIGGRFSFVVGATIYNRWLQQQTKILSRRIDYTSGFA